MSSKSDSILQKVAQERERGDFHKALKRLGDAIQKDGKDLDLYTEAVEVALEASDSLQAVEFFKRAHTQFPSQAHSVWNFAVQKLGSFNDPILASYMFELALKKRELGTAEEILETLKDQTVNDLLKRTRNKKQTLNAATSGGAGFRQEILVNALAEAMLCVRTKRFQEAVRLLLRIVDEKPVEHETLTPLFARLEKAHKKGSITFGHGCCLLAGDKHHLRGLQKIVSGVEQAPALAQEAIARLEGLQGSDTIPSEELDYGLARIHLINGDDLLAAARLNTILMGGHGKAPIVVELLTPQIETIGEDLALHLLFLDAAMASKREEHALKHARRLYKSTGHRAELLEWFETKAQAQALTPEFQVAHGEMLLDQGMHERAVEIFRYVLVNSPQDQHAVAAALSRHSSNPYAQALLGELNTDIEEQGGEPAGDGLEIQHYGNSGGFSFDAAREAEAARTDEQHAPPTQSQPAQPPQQARQPEPADVGLGLSGERDPFAEPAPEAAAAPTAPDNYVDLDTGIERSASPFGNAAPPVAPQRRGGWAEQSQPRPKPEMRPRSMDLNGPAVQPEPTPAHVNEPAPQPQAPAAPTQAQPQPHAPAAPTQAPPQPQAPAAPTQAPPQAQATAAPTQAAAPSHMHSPGAPVIPEPPAVIHAPPPPPEPGAEPVAPAPAAPRAPAPSEPAPVQPAQPYHVTLSDEPEPAAAAASPQHDDKGFAAQFSKFKRKELTNIDVLLLLERAHRDGRWEEMKSLLSFVPANIGEDIKRKFHLAGYYLDIGQALNALVVLRTVNVGGLGRIERRAFLLRLANCYRALNRFDAAHSVYLRMLSEEEDFPKLEEIARNNYQQYVDQLAEDAVVLEKVTLV